MAANHDSAESSVGNCTKEPFLVGERNLLEDMRRRFLVVFLSRDLGPGRPDVKPAEMRRSKADR